MPLKSAGRKAMKSMKKTYGKKKGENVFYAMINSGKLPKHKMEGKPMMRPMMKRMGRHK